MAKIKVEDARAQIDAERAHADALETAVAAAEAKGETEFDALDELHTLAQNAIDALSAATQS